MNLKIKSFFGASIIALLSQAGFAAVTLINDSEEPATFSITTSHAGNSRGTEVTVKANSQVVNSEISKAARLNRHSIISVEVENINCGASNNIENLVVIFNGKSCSVK